jgi:hypothetical protein
MLFSNEQHFFCFTIAGSLLNHTLYNKRKLLFKRITVLSVKNKRNHPTERAPLPRRGVGVRPNEIILRSEPLSLGEGLG